MYFIGGKIFNSNTFSNFKGYRTTQDSVSSYSNFGNLYFIGICLSGERSGLKIHLSLYLLHQEPTPTTTNSQLNKHAKIKWDESDTQNDQSPDVVFRDMLTHGFLKGHASES